MKDIHLALSGGGIRAMVFHLGVLRSLAEREALERITRLSSVSGGSLISGLIVKEAGMVWPSSENFPEIYAALRTKLCTVSLIGGMLRQMIKPANWKYVLYRANILAKTLESDWGVTECLDRLPQVPEFSFEGTTAETGKRFRFQRETLGEYSLGYAESGSFPLSEAMAVSAAFPGGIGPLKLDTRAYRWRSHSNAKKSGPKVCPYDTLHLYDGGIYDNLGLEPFFDAGSACPKKEGAYLIVSDAGAAFRLGFSYTTLNPLRLKRVLDVVMEQCRSLRVRGICRYFSHNPGSGTYLWINTCLKSDPGGEERLFASSFPTTLRRLSYEEFDRLAQHGYRVAAERIKLDSEAVAGDQE